MFHMSVIWRRNPKEQKYIYLYIALLSHPIRVLKEADFLLVTLASDWSNHTPNG